MVFNIVILLAACASIAVCHDPDIFAKFQQLPNGDESEIISIDLKKSDGSEDIKLLAQLSFHLNEDQIYVNGHPVIHNVVNQLHMRVKIVEIERGIKREPRLAPVTFRVLVVEQSMSNGEKMFTVEEEFIKVEENEVMQVDIKQIVWNGGKRLPWTSISYEDSKIRQVPHENDHHTFVKDHDVDDDEKHAMPHLPNESGYAEDGNEEHVHKASHWRVVCWFRRLSIGGKIAVICAGVVSFLSLALSMIVCWRKHCIAHKTLHLQVPMDNSVIVDGCEDEKDVAKIPSVDGEFHMELNECYVEVNDKKALVE